ncbi:MAG TPA: Fis family transcriptional regulator [Actinomycetaceae bacterium]|nr:Fis family transcriptional regulator [Actinomycetaceae bacterium]
MRWDELLADLEGEFDGALAAQQDDEVAELAEGELAQVEFADRIRARLGGELHVRLINGETLRGRLRDSAAAWLLVELEGSEMLIPMQAVVAAWPLGLAATHPTGVERRLGIGHALRALARDGSHVRVRTTAGDHTGRISRVGRDHIDVVDAAQERPETRSIRLVHVVALQSR